MSKLTFDEWWGNEGRDLFQRADGWLVAKAAWDAATTNAAPQDKTLSGVCPEPAVAAPKAIDLPDRLREACDGHPHAKIPWPHRLLHEAADEITSLRKTIKALKNPNRCPNCHLAYTDD